MEKFQLKTNPALVMRRKDSSVGQMEDRKLLDNIWEMSSVIIDYYSLVKLTASEMLHMTVEVRHKSNQLQSLLQISEQQLGQALRISLQFTPFVQNRNIHIFFLYPNIVDIVNNISLASEVVIKHLSSINEVARQLKLCREILQVKLTLLKTLGKTLSLSLEFHETLFQSQRAPASLLE